MWIIKQIATVDNCNLISLGCSGQECRTQALMLPHVRCKVAGVFIHQLLSVFDWWTLLVCEDGHLTQPLPANPMLGPSVHQQQSPKAEHFNYLLWKSLVWVHRNDGNPEDIARTLTALPQQADYKFQLQSNKCSQKNKYLW